VLGGGTAGLVAAQTAASLGASVVLVERDAPGGDCLWTGCVPSKTLLAVAHDVARARTTGTRAGLTVTGPVDFDAVMARVHKAIATIAPVDSVETLEGHGVTVVTGTGVFTGPDRLSVNGTTLTFQQAMIATGATPVIPPIPGLAASRALTSDTVWSLSELPGRLVVLGGGSIGCELGQAFARLGSRVTLVEGEQRLLPDEDPRVAELLLAALRADGVDVRLRQTCAGVNDTSVVLADQSIIGFDQVLVALGRTAHTDGLGLDAAGVRTRADGTVQVDQTLRTTNPRIWAAGDLTGHPPFTHTAGVHASLAVTNALLGLHRGTTKTAIPRVTFTSPEIASVGVRAPGPGDARNLRVATIDHDQIDRAVAEDETAGYSELVLDRRGRVVGATIVGARAGESIGEAMLAIQNGLTARAIASTTHPYPTFNDGIWNAAILDVRRQLGRAPVRAVIKLLRRIRRNRRNQSR